MEVADECKMKIDVSEPYRDRFETKLKLTFTCSDCNISKEEVVTFQQSVTELKETLETPGNYLEGGLNFARSKRILGLCPIYKKVYQSQK